MATETLAPISAPPNLETEALSMVSQLTAYPSSPGQPTVSFPEFLSGVLESLLSGDNHLPCPLPPEFCAVLLRPDDVGAADQGQEEDFSSKGVPKYPLYKYIARGLSEWISTGSFPRTVELMVGIAEDDKKSEKIEGWTQKVVDLGGSLAEVRSSAKSVTAYSLPLVKHIGESLSSMLQESMVCEEVKFQLQCQEPYYSQLKDGRKTVEGRCAGGYYTELQVGNGLLFSRTLLLNVEDIKRYNTFNEMLEIEGLINVLPGVATTTEGVQVYRKFYSETKEKEAGVVGIHVRHPVNQRQPFELLYDLLKELDMEGLRALLGMRSTMGSIADALPPPTSQLLSAFSVVNNETEVPGSKLSVGARALAKHVHRCSNGWWGKFTGTEAAKNALSLHKLRSMIEDAIWMNVHVVPVPVFEIRVRGGYGARWSRDGTQFRGFLEPPMEEGYLHKWRH